MVLGTGTILLLTAASMYSNVLLAMLTLTVSIGVNRAHAMLFRSF